MNILLILLLGCSTEQGDQNSEVPQHIETLPAVKTEPIVTKVLANAVTVSATLEALQTAVLLPKSAGRVAEVPVRVGQSISEGEVLMRVEASDYNYGLQDAKGLQSVAAAQLAQAEVNLLRFKKLSEEGSATQSQLDEIETGVLLAQAQLQRADAAVGIAQSRLRDTVLKAPFSGTVIARNIDVGELVGGPANQPPLMLADTTQMRAIASISEQMSANIQPGLSVKITVPAVPSFQSEGQIEHVNAAVDPITRTVTVEVGLDNADGLLKHGMSALIHLEATNEPQAMIPRQALLERSNGTAMVYVYVNGSVSKRQVRYAPSTEAFVPVLEGLTEGEQVVVAGLSRLKDGMQVKEPSE
ncbi:MAG: efflux RND transporter periplasmic adaptor subunit [Myxococcota bacterium]|nr:efflux RND transporter periplasmic adaptor subunit [Myxococcota bacterium]